MPLVPCTCNASIVSHQPVEIPTKKGPMEKYNIEFKCIDGPNTGSTAVFSGGTSTDKSRDFTEAAMKTAGWDGQSNPVGQNWSKLPDGKLRIVSVTIDNRKYTDDDGKEHEVSEVKYVNPLGSRGVSEKIKMAPEKQSAWGEKFAAVAKARAEAKGNEPAKTEDAAPNTFGGEGGGGTSEDDIPFARNNDLCW